MRRRLAAVAALLAAGVASAEQTRTIVAGEQFEKGGLHRLLFGKDYRELWTTPVDLPALDMRSFAGGLTPTRRLGHGQTKALAFEGQDGVAYTFRGIVKDPVGLLPPELRETIAAKFVRDQMASQHPAGHVVVPVLLDAVGLLHNTPRLVVLPDDPALGEFREDFAGVAGDLEEYTGQQGFGGSEEIIEGAEMWKRLDASPETRVDSYAYLTARLVDHLIGDWDRHREQWRWAKLPGKPKWQPIPEDRDQAFVRFQGLVIDMVRAGLPLLLNFGPEHASLDGLTFDSWDVDRRLLTDLEWPAWEVTARSVKEKLSDDVIETAVRRMPQAWVDRAGAEMIAALKKRRDGLPEHTRRFYRYLARQVDVRGTEIAETVDVERFAGGDVELRMSAAGAEPYFRRRFLSRETSEVRLLLFGADDRVTVKGPRGGITLRIAPGDGNDVVDDSASGGARISDSSGGDRVAEGPGTAWDRKPYQAPPPSPRGAWIPPRDWGRRTLVPVIRITGSSDLGVFASIGLQTTGFGFRKDPWADKQYLRAGYSSRLQGLKAEYEGEFRFENSRLSAGLYARASGVDVIRFHGFGNETLATEPASFYQVGQDQLVLQPSLRTPLGRATLAFGPVVKHVTTDAPADSLLAQTRPYGIEDFGQAGAWTELTLDTRDKPGLPSRGFDASAGGSWYPGVWSVRSRFGELHGEVATYLQAPVALEPTLVLRAGGKRVFGSYPFHESAFLGGGASLRGLGRQRYAGDGAAWGSGELRLSLAKAFLLVPGEVGLFGLADVGRVWIEGEESDRWHRGFGGGVFFASPNRNNSFSIAVARGEGLTRFYLRAGLAF